jgi:uncharacterized membrane protein
MLDSIQNTGFGVSILGLIGSFIAIVLIKLSAGYVNKVSPDYSHEVHVFRLLFNESDKKRDNTDHIYLLILSCAFTLGLLMLTCTSALVFQTIKMNDPKAYYSLVVMFIATVLCLYGVVKGLDSINKLMDVHLQRKDAATDANELAKG